MKYFFALCCFLAAVLLSPGLSAAEWLTDFQKAKAESLKTGRPIYILFTNSDAAACLSLERTIFARCGASRHYRNTAILQHCLNITEINIHKSSFLHNIGN